MTSINSNHKPGSNTDSECQYIDYRAVQDIALGATFLGAGGGGDTYSTQLQLKQLLQDGAAIKLIQPGDLGDNDLVAPCGWLGAPGVQKEKYPSGQEGAIGLDKLEDVMGARVSAIMPIEIGGQNGITPFVLAAQRGVPVLDCDGMGRAFPHADMVTFNIYGCSASPAVVSDTHGNVVVLHSIDNQTLERLVRPLAVAMGGHCHLFDYPLSGKNAKRFCVPGTISLAWKIGRVMRESRENQCNAFTALLDYLKTTEDYCHAFCLYQGKIIDIERNFDGGFLVGRVTIVDPGRPEPLLLQFQNEFIYARCGDAIVASVPDIIAVLDQDMAHPISTENLKYGQRVRVVATSVPALLRSDQALSFMGPEAFGLDFQYRPLEALNASSEQQQDVKPQP